MCNSIKFHIMSNDYRITYWLLISCMHFNIFLTDLNDLSDALRFYTIQYYSNCYRLSISPLLNNVTLQNDNNIVDYKYLSILEVFGRRKNDKKKSVKCISFVYPLKFVFVLSSLMNLLMNILQGI